MDTNKRSEKVRGTDCMYVESKPSEQCEPNSSVVVVSITAQPAISPQTHPTTVYNNRNCTRGAALSYGGGCAHYHAAAVTLCSMWPEIEYLVRYKSMISVGNTAVRTSRKSWSAVCVRRIIFVWYAEFLV